MSELPISEFEALRPHLLGVARRMLGSEDEAEDAVQEGWLRARGAWSGGASGGVANLGGWLTTIVARVCLDRLRARRSRREEALAGTLADLGNDPGEEALWGDSVGRALGRVVRALSPAERVAFVLHDLFGVSFEEIAEVVERSPAAARQLASRGRRRVRSGSSGVDVDVAAHGEIVRAFREASRGGDLAGLLRLLAPDVVLRADAAAVGLGAPKLVRGAEAVVGTFVGRARGSRLASVAGVAALVWAPDGVPDGEVRSLFDFTVVGGQIAVITLVADPGRLQGLGVRIR